MARKNGMGLTRVTTAQLRANPSRILRRLRGEKREKVVLCTDGKAKAVLLGLEDYLELIAPENPLMAEIHAYSVAHGGDQITMEEIDAEIAACRAEQRERNAASIYCD
jgi:hypothetical protein